jgi:hypothetical protein
MQYFKIFFRLAYEFAQADSIFYFELLTSSFRL